MKLMQNYGKRWTIIITLTMDQKNRWPQMLNKWTRRCRGRFVFVLLLRLFFVVCCLFLFFFLLLLLQEYDSESECGGHRHTHTHTRRRYTQPNERSRTSADKTDRQRDTLPNEIRFSMWIEWKCEGRKKRAFGKSNVLNEGERESVAHQDRPREWISAFVHCVKERGMQTNEIARQRRRRQRWRRWRQQWRLLMHQRRLRRWRQRC